MTVPAGARTRTSSTSPWSFDGPARSRRRIAGVDVPARRTGGARARRRADGALPRLQPESLSGRIVSTPRRRRSWPSSSAAWRRRCTTRSWSQGTKPVMVTSANPGDGKTLTVANLALTLSESYRRAGPADRRRPAPAVAARRLQRPERRRPQRRPEGAAATRKPERHQDHRHADAAPGRTARSRSDELPDVDADGARSSRRRRSASTGSSSTPRRSACSPTPACWRAWSTARSWSMRAGQTPHAAVDRAVERARPRAHPRRRPQRRRIDGRRQARSTTTRGDSDDARFARRAADAGKARHAGVARGTHVATIVAGRRWTTSLIVAAVVLAVVRAHGGPTHRAGWLAPAVARQPDRRRPPALPALPRPLRSAHAARSPAADGRPARRRSAPARRCSRCSTTGCRGLVIGRGIFLIGALFIVLFVAGWRIAFEWLSSRLGPARAAADRRHQRARRSSWRARLYERRHQLGVELVGFVDAPGAERARSRPRRHHPRHHRRHPGDRPRSRRRSRRRQPRRCARQAARWTSCSR